MVKFDIEFANSTQQLDYVTPERSEGQLERIGLFVHYTRMYGYEDGLLTGDSGLLIGNFVIASGSFLFTAIAIIGPSIGWEKFYNACTIHPIRMLVPLLGFPLMCGIIWIFRGFLFVHANSQEQD